MDRCDVALRSALLAFGLLAALPVCAADYYIANRDTDALIAALRQANSTPEPDTIHLANAGLYPLPAAQERDLLLPRIDSRITIRGNGSELRRNSDESLALLEVGESGELDLHVLTLAEGGRGSVRNYGSLRLQQSAVVDATTRSENAIVLNYGHFEAERSVIGYNQVAGAGRDAAIVLNYGSMRLADCRLAGNSLSRRFPTLAAAPVLNYGQLQVERLALEGNAVTDGYDGPSSDTVLNLGLGRVLGPDAARIASVAIRP